MQGVSGYFPVPIPGLNGLIFNRTGGTATAVSIEITYRKKYRR
jgi:hypothetical protein